MLADSLGVSRPTMRRAIQELVDKGLLVRKRGVRPRPLLPRSPGRLDVAVLAAAPVAAAERRPSVMVRTENAVAVPAIAAAPVAVVSSRLRLPSTTTPRGASASRRGCARCARIRGRSRCPRSVAAAGVLAVERIAQLQVELTQVKQHNAASAARPGRGPPRGGACHRGGPGSGGGGAEARGSDGGARRSAVRAGARAPVGGGRARRVAARGPGGADGRGSGARAAGAAHGGPRAEGRRAGRQPLRGGAPGR